MTKKGARRAVIFAMAQLCAVMLLLLARVVTSQGRGPSGASYEFRLLGAANKGLLQIRPVAAPPGGGLAASWGTIDAGSFDNTTAQAACTTLGFPSSSNFTTATYFTSAGGSGQIYYASCPPDKTSGNGEWSLQQCSFFDASEFARHGSDVGVRCDVNCPPGSYFSKDPRGQGECVACGPASPYSSVDGMSCSAACPAGTYAYSSNDTTGRACMQCPPGTQNPSMATTSGLQEACKYCPANSSSSSMLFPSLNSTSCVETSLEVMLNGASTAEGLLLIRPNSSASWGTVINFYFDKVAAAAACHSLGYVAVDNINGSFSSPGGGSGSIYMVSCASDAFSLSDCLVEDYTEYGIHNYDVSVRCVPLCPLPGMVLTNKTACVECADSTFSSVDRFSCIDGCPAGAFGDVGNRSCTPCPPWTYNPMANETSPFACVPCDAGSIPTPNQTACTPSLWEFRLVGSARNEGRLEVRSTKANAGASGRWGPVEFWSFSDAYATAACHSLGFPAQTTASYYGGGSKMTDASRDSYYVYCSATEASPYFLQACSIVLLARSSAASSSSASSGSGYGGGGGSGGAPFEFSDQYTYLQCVVDCPRGFYFAANGTCVACPDGTYASPDRLTCVASCPAGSYSNSMTLTCTKCPTGTFNPANGSVSSLACLRCPMGTFGPIRGLAACALCPYGTYNPFEGAINTYDCFYCPSGTSSNAGRTACDQPSWEFRLNGTLNQGRLELRPNSTSPWGTICGFSFDLSAATAACHSLGFPSDVTAKPYIFGGGSGPFYMQDLLCTTDTYYLQNCSYAVYDNTCDHSLDAAVHCVVSCPIGTVYSGDTGKSCSLCGNGTFSDVDRLSCVAACGYGSFANETSRGCQKCAAGSFNPTKESTSAEDCQPCLPGSYNPYQGMPSCIPCPPGTYNPRYGSEYAWECLSCPGSSTPNANATGCESSNWEVRLVVEGTQQVAKTRGLLQIRPNASASEWGTVYDYSFDNTTAQAICGALGFPSTAFTYVYRATGGTGEVYNVRCDFPSSPLSQCSIQSNGRFWHGNDVGLSCVVSCNGGEYYTQGSCIPCPKDLPFASSDSASCVSACPAGTFTNETALQCVACPKWTFNPHNASTSPGACQPCGGSSYPSLDQASCLASKLEFGFPPQNDTTQNPFLLLVRSRGGAADQPWGIVAPYYNYFTQEMAVAACRSIGLNADKIVATFFVLIPKGVRQVYSFDCSSLPAQSVNYLEQCKAAIYPGWSGQYAVGLQCAADCGNLPSGFFNMSSRQCEQCPPQQPYSSINRTACVTTCPRGTYASSIAKACIACPAGSYNAKANATSEKDCVLCATGSYSVYPQATACTSCTVNQYLPQRGASSSNSCQDCSYGQFASQSGDSCVNPTWEYQLANNATATGAQGWLLVRPTRWSPWGQVVAWPFSRSNVVAACHALGVPRSVDVQVTVDRAFTYPFTADTYYIACPDTEQDDLSNCDVSYYGSSWQYFYLSMSCAVATQCSDLNGQPAKFCANSTLNCVYCAASGTCMPAAVAAASCPSYVDVCSSWNGNSLSCLSFAYLSRNISNGTSSSSTTTTTRWFNTTCSKCRSCQYCADSQVCADSQKISSLCVPIPGGGAFDWCSNFDGNQSNCNTFTSLSLLPCDRRTNPAGCGPCAFCASSGRCMSLTKISPKTCCGYTEKCSVWNGDLSGCSDAYSADGKTWLSCATQKNPNLPRTVKVCSCFFNLMNGSCHSTSTDDPCNSYSNDQYSCNVLTSYSGLTCAYCADSGVCASTASIANICPSWTNACHSWSGPYGGYYCQSQYYTGGLSCQWCEYTNTCMSVAERMVQCEVQCPLAAPPSTCVQAGCVVCNVSMNYACVLDNGTCAQSCQLFSSDPTTCKAAVGCFYCSYTQQCLANTQECDPCNLLRVSECQKLVFNRNTVTFVLGCSLGDICEACYWCDTTATCVNASSPAATAEVCQTPCGLYNSEAYKCNKAPGCSYCDVGTRAGQCVLASDFEAQCDPCTYTTMDQYSCNSMYYNYNTSSFTQTCSNPLDNCRKCAYCPSTGKCRGLNSSGSIASLCPGWTSPCTSIASYCYPDFANPFNVNCSQCGSSCLLHSDMAQCTSQPCTAWNYDQAGCAATQRCKFCSLTSSQGGVGVLMASVCIPLASPCTTCTIDPQVYRYMGFQTASIACAAHPVSFYGPVVRDSSRNDGVRMFPNNGFIDTTTAGRCAFCPITSDCLPVLANGSLEFPCPKWSDVCSSFDGDAETCNSVTYNRTGQLVVDPTRCSGGRCGSCGYCRSTNKCMKMRLMNSSTCPGYQDACSVWDSLRDNCTSLALLAIQGTWQQPPCVNASCTYCGYCPKSNKCFSLQSYASQCGVAEWTGPCGMFSASECPLNASVNYNPVTNALSMNCGGSVCCPHSCAVCPATGLCNTIRVGDMACSTKTRPAMVPFSQPAPAPNPVQTPAPGGAITPQPTSAFPVLVTYTFTNASAINQSSFLATLAQVADLPNGSASDLVIIAVSDTTVTVQFPSQSSGKAASTTEAVTQIQADGFLGLLSAAYSVPSYETPSHGPGMSLAIIIGAAVGAALLAAVACVAVKKGKCSRGPNSHQTFAYRPEDFTEGVDKVEDRTSGVVQMSTIQDASERRHTVEDV